MLYIGKFKRLLDCNKCNRGGPPWECKAFSEEAHLIWWPEESPLGKNIKSPDILKKTMICSRGEMTNIEKEIMNYPTLAFVRLHRGKIFLVPIKPGEDPSDIFTKLVGWTNPIELVRNLGKF